MSTQDFCYWLQGYFEISGEECLTKEQVKIVKDHLKLVFDKQTPIYNWNWQFQPADYSAPIKHTDVWVTC